MKHLDGSKIKELQELYWLDGYLSRIANDIPAPIQEEPEHEMVELPKLKEAHTNRFTPRKTYLPNVKYYKPILDDYFRAVERINNMGATYDTSVEVLIWDAYPGSGKHLTEFEMYVKSHGYAIERLSTTYINCTLYKVTD